MLCAVQAPLYTLSSVPVQLLRLGTLTNSTLLLVPLQAAHSCSSAAGLFLSWHVYGS